MCLHYFSRASATKYHELGGLKQQKSAVSQFWGLGVQNQSVGRTPPSEVCSGTTPFLVEAPGGWLAIFAVCLSVAWIQSLSLSSHGLFPVSLHLHRASLWGHQSAPVWPHLNCLHQQWCYFQIRSRSEILGLEFNLYFWGTHLPKDSNIMGMDNCSY